MKKIALVLFFLISTISNANILPNIAPSELINFNGFSWTPLNIGWDWDQPDARDDCFHLQVGGKGGFRLPTKTELVAILGAHKLKQINKFNKSPHPIWTDTKETHTWPDGSTGQNYVACTVEGNCSTDLSTQMTGRREGEMICVRGGSKTVKEASGKPGSGPKIVLTQSSTAETDALRAKQAKAALEENKKIEVAHEASSIAAAKRAEAQSAAHEALAKQSCMATDPQFNTCGCARFRTNNKEGNCSK